MKKKISFMCYDLRRHLEIWCHS